MSSILVYFIITKGFFSLTTTFGSSETTVSSSDEVCGWLHCPGTDVDFEAESGQWICFHSEMISSRLSSEPSTNARESVRGDVGPQ